MGIPSEMRDVFIQRRRNSFVIPSPAEEEKRSRAERFSQGFYFSFPQFLQLESLRENKKNIKSEISNNFLT